MEDDGIDTRLQKFNDINQSLSRIEEELKV